ncbi:MAG: alpha/beta fold hydrolase [Flavobacteriales bacterium]
MFNYLIPSNLRVSNREIVYFKKEIAPMEEYWKKIKCDVLIMHGTNDPLVPYPNATYAVEQLAAVKSIKFVSIRNANHFIPWQHFDLVKENLITTFDMK